MLESDSRGGVSAPGGVVPHHALRQTPPVNRMTNRCKNITLAITSLRPVISIFTSIEIYDIFKYYVSRNGQYKDVNKTAIENQQYVRILKVNCSLKVQFSFFCWIICYQPCFATEHKENKKNKTYYLKRGYQRNHQLYTFTWSISRKFLSRRKSIGEQKNALAILRLTTVQSFTLYPSS